MERLLVFVCVAQLAFSSPAEGAAVTPQEILARVANAKADPAVAAQALKELDGLIAANPRDAAAFGARGQILSALDKKAEAVAAYDAALRIDPRFPDASYNAGVILLHLGKVNEGIAHLEAAAATNPKDADAFYDLGQARYNTKDFAKALAAWSAARALTPNDFEVAKKVLQAHNALGPGHAADAARARAEVIALWRSSKDPRVARLKEVVFDQFDAGGWHVYAYETLDPKGDLFYLYTFRVAGADDKVMGSVNLESSAVIRERNVPYILGVDVPGRHTTLGYQFAKAPDYFSELKPLVIKVVAETFKK